MNTLKPLNTAIVIGNDVKNIVLSFNIPQLRSIRVAHDNFPTEPEVNFNRRMDHGGLGIKDGDLYYITAPINTDVHVTDTNGKRTIIECNADGVKEINL